MFPCQRWGAGEVGGHDMATELTFLGVGAVPGFELVASCSGQGPFGELDFCGFIVEGGVSGDESKWQSLAALCGSISFQ